MLNANSERTVNASRVKRKSRLPAENLSPETAELRRARKNDARGDAAGAPGPFSGRGRLREKRERGRAQLTTWQVE